MPVREYGHEGLDALGDVSKQELSPKRLVSTKPAEVGIRILTLDGGGIRGIIELIILEQIERALGYGFHIQDFFDLIVGTSTGGIIALGLGACGYSVKRCKKDFRLLCQEAFRKRKGVDIPGIDHLMSASYYSKYQTRLLENAMRYFYGEDNLVGGLKQQALEGATGLTNVAVPTTTTAGSVVVLANYNRPRSRDYMSYEFHRSDMKIWEAARATSAAPGFFRSFFHPPSGHYFIDGGIYHNNPIEIAMMESKLLWPDEAAHSPDIVLSLGTGYDPKEFKEERVSKSPGWGLVSHIQTVVKFAINHIQLSLDSERAWKTYLERHSLRSNNRFIRANLTFDSETPELDDVGALDKLQGRAKQQFKNSRFIRSIADRLIASSFYFQLVTYKQKNDGSATVKGIILCRFPSGSKQVDALEQVLLDQSNRDYHPYFLIRETEFANSDTLVMDRDTIRSMFANRTFSMEITIHPTHLLAETEIMLCLGNKFEPALYPISGFPRCLVDARRPNLRTPRASRQFSCSRSRSPRR